jgi:hypothetical protein
MIRMPAALLLCRCPWGGLAVLCLLGVVPQALGQAPGPPARLSAPTFGQAFDAPVVQEKPASSPGPSAPAAVPTTLVDAEVVPASCVNCETGGVLSPYRSEPFGGGCRCGAGDQCIPGRERCCPCEADNCFDRFFCCLYDCICCPDPCYDPKWLPIADSAFYVDAARPQTQTRIRIDPSVGIILPDRAEFFWARADGTGLGPKPPAPFRAELSIRNVDTYLYTEAATGRVGAFFEMSYRSLDPDVDPHAAGFGDMNVGVKTLLLDCELIQISMQFRTYLPVGNGGKGLGTGHTSLEPSLLMALRLAPDSYLQAQVSEWIPVGGDPNYMGAVLHYHFSWNKEIYRFHPQVPLIGTLEMSGYSFQDGSFTDPVNGPFQHAGGYTYFYAGPGLRLFVCDKLDFGIATSWALSEQHLAATTYRAELRLRF